MNIYYPLKKELKQKYPDHFYAILFSLLLGNTTSIEEPHYYNVITQKEFQWKNTFIPIEFAFGTDMKTNIIYIETKNVLDKISTIQAIGRVGRHRKAIESIVVTSDVNIYRNLI